MAEEIDRRLGIAVFELAVGRAHAAHRLDLTRRALGDAGDLLLPHLPEKVVPALAETASAQVEGLDVRQHANAHSPFGIDREGADTSAALIQFRAVLGGNRAIESRRERSPLSDALGIFEIHFHDFPRLEPDAYRAAGAVDPRIDHVVELEPD